MASIAGFLTGSATAIALMLLMIGLPELGAPDVPAAKPVAAAVPEPAAALPPEPTFDPEPDPEPEPQPEPAPATVVAAPLQPPTAAARWHPFWSPFGSRIAADGFVRRLEAVTGFDYRVVKVENGVYEVAFAYVDDKDRDAMLSTIAAATGLELPDS